MFYGNEYNFVMLLTAAEILSMSFSLFTGFAADLIDRCRLLLLGYIGRPPYFMVSIYGIKYIIPLFFLAGIGESTVLTSSAGVVMDRGSSSRSFCAIYSAGLNWFTGIIAIICWLIPVYGFYELATSISVSRLAPRKSQATAMGAVTLMKSMGGLIILLIGLLIFLSELSVFLLIFIFSIIALISILSTLSSKSISFSNKK